FGKDYFSPVNMIISVVSKSSPENIYKYFKNFTSDKNTELFSGLGYTDKYKTITKPVKINLKGRGEQAYLYFGFQKIIDENEKPALKSLSLLLNSDIIFNIREKQGLAYRMKAGINTIGNKGMFYINMGTRPENVNKLIPQFPNLFNTKFVDGITQDKLQRAINMYLGRMMFRRLSSINQAYYLGHSFYFYNDINYDNKFLTALKNVTLKEVKAVVEKYLKVENPVEVYIR
ncbi:MAG TPA: insulinase family protein, partial [Ignavibacteria bacterium]|nr:insulinase family protein [Ignavibacteria bacterium]